MSSAHGITPAEVVDFWYSKPIRDQWFNASKALDDDIRERFQSAWRAARDGQLSDWEHSAEGALALVILLDQLALNMFRGQPASHSTEAASRQVAERAIAAGLDQQLGKLQKLMLYMPYMHSESIADQDRVIELFTAAGLSEASRWANHHRDIIKRFGRFPHRNALLGRDNSTDEIEWLASPDAFKG